MSKRIKTVDKTSVSTEKKLTKKQEAELLAGTLPVFQGYTIDIRCGQIRKIPLDDLPFFIDMNSEEGRMLIDDFIPTLNLKKPRDAQILEDIYNYYFKMR